MSDSPALLPLPTLRCYSQLAALQSSKIRSRHLNLPAVQIQTSPIVLTFGAADPIGAIGIQADIAAFAAMGCHGLSVVTALLISDTTKIEDMEITESDWVSDQARVVLEDMAVAAFKVSAVGSIENVSVIAEIVSDYPEIPLILDPFITAIPDDVQDGDDVLMAIRELLLPQASLLLLSAGELDRLAETWREPTVEDTLEIDALHVIELGCAFLLVTGIPGAAHEVTNTLYSDGGVIRQDSWPRLPGAFTGAGTTMSAAIAALMANGLEAPEAVFEAQEFTHAALLGAQRLGMGKLIPDRYFWARETTQDIDADADADADATPEAAPPH
ncbi:MAG: hydroxymethylpyrimidine/phosphomethylpyrimidine kinase [Bradyrhizobium sp.]|jgi:hydroxymethylpyrimidine/phosphomethylpyrimidine kinase